MYILVTNNPLVKAKYENRTKELKVEFVEAPDCMKVLETTRNHMHLGMSLQTHPMAGSVKPNQNPYESILISDEKDEPEDANLKLMVMENAITNCREFLQKRPLPDWEEKYLEDFRFVDNSLIESALSEILH